MWYYMSLFYSEKDMGMAYAWITTGTALSQVHSIPHSCQWKAARMQSFSALQQPLAAMP
jgi:hypothetical protein